MVTDPVTFRRRHRAFSGFYNRFFSPYFASSSSSSSSSFGRLKPRALGRTLALSIRFGSGFVGESSASWPREMMPDPIPACFRGGAPAGPPPSTAGGPSLTASVYETRLGLAALTWSRTVLGLSLRAVLRLDDRVGEDEEEEPLRFRIRPWLLWKRRGAKRFHFKDRRGCRRSADFAWDLTRAGFPPGGGPEPAAGYFVAVSIDAEMLLVAGDLADEAYKKTRAQRLPACPSLVSRLEHVVMGDQGDGRRSYRTRARFGGRDREILIELGAKEKGKEVAMSVGVDGDRVLHVRRLRWKFRGSEKVELPGGAGGRIQFSWDLHNWFFQPKDEAGALSTSVAAASGAAELGQAVFMLRFHGEEKPPQTEGHSMNSIYKSLVSDGYNGKSRNINWSWSSSGGGGERNRGGRKRSMRKTSSSSSTSSASSASTSTVMEWASPEEMELQRAQGFSLLVYAWKT